MREALWPSAGWRRTLAYWGHRLIRLQGTPHSIALGLAIGAAISMTPFIGLHVVLTLLLCWVFGGQSLAGLIGTLVGNPWTFPVIFLFTYRIGCAILGFDTGINVTINLSLDTLIHSPFQSIAPMLGPMIVGSIPAAIAVWWATYVPAKYFITVRRRRRSAKLSERARKVFIDAGAPQG